MERKQNSAKNFLLLFGLAAIFMVSLVIFWFVADSKQGHEVSKKMQEEGSVTEYQANPPGGDFTLQSADGQVKLSDFRGKIVLIFFGYTSCTTACPATMNEISNTLSLLTPEEAEQVQPIFISFDPDRDTLASIKEYAGYFSPKILGLGGTHEEIATVAKQFGAMFSRDNLIESELGYGFSHTSTTYLVDQNGVYADSFPYDIGYEVIAEEIKFRLTNPQTAEVKEKTVPATHVSESKPKAEEPSFDAFAPTQKK